MERQLVTRASDHGFVYRCEVGGLAGRHHSREPGHTHSTTWVRSRGRICRYSPVSGRQIVAPERHFASADVGWECHLPADALAVFAQPRPGPWLDVSDAEGIAVQSRDHSGILLIRVVLRSECVVDDAEGLVPPMALAMLGKIVDECDQFYVAAAWKTMSLFFGLVVSMSAAGGRA